MCFSCPLAEPEPKYNSEPEITQAPCSQCEEQDSVPVRQRDQRWCAVITTAPRENPTLRRTIASVRLNGLEPVVFAEPGSIPTNAMTHNNATRNGVWDNFRASAQWALDNTTADVILTLQDDVALHAQTKRVVDELLWPSDHVGFLSLYTAAHYQREGVTGLHRVKTAALWGACALVWPRNVLQQVLEHKITREWIGVLPKTPKRAEVIAHRRENRWHIQNSDTAIGKVLNDLKKEMWFLTPSPAMHIAPMSSIGHGGNSGKRNCRVCANHRKSLKSQLPEHKKPTAASQEYAAAIASMKHTGYTPTFAITPDLWQRIYELAQPGMVTAEFGTGVSTAAFAKSTHVAYEQRERLANAFPSAVYAPLKSDGFYQAVTWETVPQILLVDGPHNGDRLKSFPYAAAVLARGGTVFVDDTHRTDGNTLCQRLEATGATAKRHRHMDKEWAEITLTT